MIANQVRVGRIPAEALTLAAEDAPVLAVASGVQRNGGDVAAALLGQADPARLPGLRDLARAWQVGTRTGAPMADLLDQVANALRADQSVERTVASELAGPRATGRVMAVLPLCGIGLGYVLGGDPIGFLLGGPLGLGVPGRRCGARRLRSAVDRVAGPSGGAAGMTADDAVRAAIRTRMIPPVGGGGSGVGGPGRAVDLACSARPEGRSIGCAAVARLDAWPRGRGVRTVGGCIGGRDARSGGDRGAAAGRTTGVPRGSERAWPWRGGGARLAGAGASRLRDDGGSRMPRRRWTCWRPAWPPGCRSASALRAVVEVMDGPLGDDLAQVLRLTELGHGDASAWRTLADHEQLGPAALDWPARWTPGRCSSRACWCTPPGEAGAARPGRGGRTSRRRPQRAAADDLLHPRVPAAGRRADGGLGGLNALHF